MATAYIDFLTYPVATFGVAAAVYFAITNDDTLKQKLLDMLKLVALWSVGYVGMWGYKWILCALCSKGNIVDDILERLVMRSSLSADGGSRFNLLNAIFGNIKQFIDKPTALLIIVLVIASFCYLLIVYKKLRCLPVEHIRNIMPFAILAMLPFVWYSFTINHSVVHSWFTNKALVVSAFSGMCIFWPKMDKMHNE